MHVYYMQSDTAIRLVQVWSSDFAWEDIINTDGDNEETWEKFDEHFTKLPGKRATGDLESLLFKTTVVHDPTCISRSNIHFRQRFLNMSWATNWDGMRYDIVFYGDPDALDFLDTAPNAVPLAHWKVFLATLDTSWFSTWKESWPGTWCNWFESCWKHLKTISKWNDCWYGLIFVACSENSLL